MTKARPQDRIPLEVSVKEAKSLLSSGEAYLIDCREQNEWDFCRLEGALLVPLSDFQSCAASLPITDQTVIIYCHHGVRSLYAAEILRELGHRQVTSMRGGIDDWSLTLDPSVPRY